MEQRWYELSQNDGTAEHCCICIADMHVWSASLTCVRPGRPLRTRGGDSVGVALLIKSFFWGGALQELPPPPL